MNATPIDKSAFHPYWINPQRTIQNEIKYNTSNVSKGKIFQANKSIKAAVINKYPPLIRNFLEGAPSEKLKLTPARKINIGAASDDKILKCTFTSSGIK